MNSKQTEAMNDDAIMKSQSRGSGASPQKSDRESRREKRELARYFAEIIECHDQTDNKPHFKEGSLSHHSQQMAANVEQQDFVSTGSLNGFEASYKPADLLKT